MRTTINLQGLFSYSAIPLIVTSIIFVLVTIYIFLKEKETKKSKIAESKIEKIPEKNIRNIPVIKDKYLKQLDLIEYKYTNEIIDLRKSYQLISEAIRMFVFEVTDITTQNYSLSEIKKLDIPDIYELIEEYYAPEFAFKTVGDFNNSINKARRVINKWN